MNNSVRKQSSKSKDGWWSRPGLVRVNSILEFQGRKLDQAEFDCCTPIYLYGQSRIEENTLRLLNSLEHSHRNSRLFYAMKSNRNKDVLRFLSGFGKIGIDACSPGEVELALECGFRDSQISFTATGMSRKEWEQVLQYSGIVVNADSFGDIDKISKIDPGRDIGIRLNLDVALGYRQNPKLMYTQRDSFSKFGIALDQLDEAIQRAKASGLNVVGLHSHCGCGYLTEQLPAYQLMLDRLRGVLDDFPFIEYLNLGGGIGIPLVSTDQSWDLSAWENLLKATFEGWNGEIYLEPGDYIVKDAGVLLLEVTNVETKSGRNVVWVNGGFNIHPEPVFYDLPLYPVPVVQRGSEETVTIVGNINEGHDVWFSDVSLGQLEEGDRIAFLNAGGYGASMSSNHCCRGGFTEILI